MSQRHVPWVARVTLGSKLKQIGAIRCRYAQPGADVD